MAWNGYWVLDGVEFINATRTETYAKNARLGWFHPLYDVDTLPFLLLDGDTYRTPLLDDAPWTDPDVPESYEFYGFYPLDITGTEDSTREATITESINDGGVPGRVRHRTRQIVFNGILLGSSACAVEYGMRWLKQALMGSACGGSPTESCASAELCYFNCAPEVTVDYIKMLANTYLTGGGAYPDPEVLVSGGDASGTGNSALEQAIDDCMFDYHRTLRGVAVTGGPTVTAKRETTDGGAVWSVTFTATCGKPFEFGDERPLVEGFMDPLVTDPWVGGDPPAGWFWDPSGFVLTEPDCAEPVYTPVFDPTCPAVIPPPTPPNVPLGCYVPPQNWLRRQFTIPREFIPLWSEAVPKIEVHARTEEVRNLRLRFYADVLGTGDVSDDPCAYCGDIVISYVPENSTLTFDASAEIVYVTTPGGGRRRADSLVFRTDGKPFDWPRLSCGFGYVVTVDLPQTQEPPVVDLSLYSRAV